MQVQCCRDSFLPSIIMHSQNLGATVPCMGDSLTSVKNCTKVARPRSDQGSKCTDEDRRNETEIEK